MLIAIYFPTQNLLSHAPSTINWISAFSEFNRYMGDFRKFFESKRKCKCLIIITLPFWLVPRLFARFESFSSECIIPLDFNEFLSVRYIVSIALQSYTFFTENVQNELFFWIYIKKKLGFFSISQKICNFAAEITIKSLFRAVWANCSAVGKRASTR